jgi:hypothetical protein
MCHLIKVTQHSRIQTRGAIFYKLVKLLARINDLDLISGIVVDLKETFLFLLQTADDICLKINEDKTKCMGTGKSEISSSTISVRCYNFRSFVCLGTMVNFDGDVMMEIKVRLHRCSN